jgi:hypothetical protein
MKTLSKSEDQQEIFRRLAQLSPDDQAQWGHMSAHQMLCHLRDSYCVALGEKTASPATGFLQRTLVKWISLWVPVHWIKGYPTRPEIEQEKGGSAPSEFASDQKALQMVLSRFCHTLREPGTSHPVFGPLKAHEWRRWGYLHADHHLRQFGR